MKINELIQDFTIFTTNEEKDLIKKIQGECCIDLFTEREKVLVDNLVRKAIMSKRVSNGSEMVFLNDNTGTG